jgi:hypothetical protein
MSALESNVGADCSLLVSPLKVKVGPIDPEVEEVLEELPEIPPELDARKRLHGTATCLPELEDELVADVLEDVVPELEPELFSDRMAKSTLPEVGLMTTSWIVPNVSPDEPCTLQLFNLLAWISCCDMLRPVGLRLLLLPDEPWLLPDDPRLLPLEPPLLPDELLPDEPEEPDEPDEPDDPDEP